MANYEYDKQPNPTYGVQLFVVGVVVLSLFGAIVCELVEYLFGG